MTKPRHPPGLMKGSIRERFEARAEPEPNTGCWLWFGTVNSSGYASMQDRRSDPPRTVGAHRVAWELYRGPVPDDLHVLHRCDVPSCVNPDHLFLGTNDDNIRDKVEKGRSASHYASATHCIAGRAFDAPNTYITKNGVRQCRRCKADRMASYKRAAHH